MRLLFLLPVILLTILAGNLDAQILKGRITDPEGEPIAYARIFAEESREGVLANDSGFFALRLRPGKHKLIVQHRGYLTQYGEITMPGAQFQHIVMPPDGYNIGTVEISAGKRDPAYAIMEQVIANKKENMREASGYIRQTYTKIRLEKDTLPGANKSKPADLSASEQQVGFTFGQKKKKAAADSVARDTVKPEWPRLVALIESRYTGNYKAPAQFKSQIAAYRKWSDEDRPGEGMSADLGPRMEIDITNPYLFDPDPAQVNLNFYKNLVQAPVLGDQPWISPLHSEFWRLTYDYRLVEKIYDGTGRIRYKIAVSPKNRQAACFEGHLWIVDGLWAIEAAALEIMPASLSYFQKFVLYHSYQQIENGAWMLISETYQYEAREGRELYRGATVAMHSDYEMNPVFPRNFFANELVSATDEAFTRDSAYWQQIRPVSLDLKEQNFVRVQDSITAYFTSPEYLRQQDSAYNRISLMDVALNGIGFRDRKRRMEYYFSPLIEQLQWFGVGGYRHALRFDIDKTFARYKVLHMGSNIDYGFNNRDLKGELRLGLTYQPKRFARVNVRAGNVYDMVNPNETISAIFSRGNFISKKYIGGGHRIELFNGFYIENGIEFADRFAIDNLKLEQWTTEIFGENNIPLRFEPYRELVLEVKLRYTPGQKYQNLPYRKVVLGSKWPTFELRYRKAIPGFFGSEIDFDFIQLKAEQEFRPGAFGVGRWSLATGGFLQAANLRFNDYTFFRGSDPFLFVNPLQNFQLLGRTLSTPQAYVRGHYVHDFGRILFNKVPLLKHTNLEMAGGASLLYVRESNFYHMEAFGGIQYPFRIKRQRLKYGLYYVASYGDYPKALGAEVKVGISFYNPVKRTWSY